MKNKEFDKTVYPLPHRAEDARYYLLLGLFFLSGTAIGALSSLKVLQPISEYTVLYIRTVLSHSAAAPDLLRISTLVLVPFVICALCAYTTFGAVVIFPFFMLIGSLAGRALCTAYSTFSIDGLLGLCTPLAVIFLVVLACTLFTAAGALSASLRMFRLALGKMPAKLPVFDLLFYQRFAAAVIILLLTAVLYTSTFTHIISAVF